MSLGVLELNDQSLLIETDQGSRHAEPGFARIDPEGIRTGEEARASAWERPHNSYNQYWNLLNQTPLAAREKWARHHADIAFAQLQSLWKGAGSPASLLVLAPGSFTDAQLSLLLGMISALPCQAVAVIDSAVAACLEAHQDTLYVDMQLHQTVITRCNVTGNEISVAEQEVFPELGLIQLYNSVARHVSNLMIDSARYDPLHSSRNEQVIFDRIPDWLTHLRWETEISASLDTRQGELPFILRAEAIRKLPGDRLASVRAFVARHSGCAVLLSHGSSPLAGIAEDFYGACEAGQSQGIEYVLTHHPLIIEQVDGLYRVQSLQRHEIGASSPPETMRPATHLLYGGQALPLRKPVSLRLDGSGLSLTSAIDSGADLTVVLKNGALDILQRSPELEAEIPSRCEPGTQWQIGEHSLRLIEVLDG